MTSFCPARSAAIGLSAARSAYSFVLRYWIDRV